MSAPLRSWGQVLRDRKAHRARIRQYIIGVGTLLGALTLTILYPPVPRLVWNASASAPVGLYAVIPGGWIALGDMVVARLPTPHRRLAAERHYLPFGMPLVKRVAAAAGDTVCARGADILINGHRATVRRPYDGRGRPMLLWHGCVRLRGRQLFLLMDHPASFDGRYFGPSAGDDIIGKAHLLWRR